MARLDEVLWAEAIITSQASYLSKVAEEMEDEDIQQSSTIVWTSTRRRRGRRRRELRLLKALNKNIDDDDSDRSKLSAAAAETKPNVNRALGTAGRVLQRRPGGQLTRFWR